ncbi:MAG TPA: glycosyltransferase family 39 protein, partial [Polyangiaceae bacterium]|nr:glycosyltransferase family 39 protein [Polyangiaceae bacterium]
GRYQDWFEILFATPERAFERAVLDHHWSVNREHPPFVKLLFALVHALFHEKLGWFASAGTAYRSVGALFGGIVLATVFAWARSIAGMRAGVAAALALGLMPRFFHHAHLACFDVPVASLWVVTAFAYARAVHSGKRVWLVGTSLLYGLLLATKHNAWLLPPALGVHLLLLGLSGQRELARRSALVVGCMLVAGPLLLFASWPWIWHDTWQRVGEYIAFHRNHEYYNMEFLGRTYHRPPMPRAYAPVMTLATVPSVVLVLFGVGLVGALSSVRRAYGPRLRACYGAGPASKPSEAVEPVVLSTLVLWCIALFVSYAPWLSSDTPIFGGTKHWITAYPFMAMLAALGFGWTLDALGRAITSPRFRVASTWIVALVIAMPPLIMTLTSHPFGLSFYTPAVGGAPGAATLGLNRTFWGYTTGSLKSAINDSTPRHAALYLHDTATASFAMFQRDGQIRSDIRGTLDIAASEVALYHHEPHMRRVEFQIWENYGTASPVAVSTYQGVPIAWMYRRPRGR